MGPDMDSTQDQNELLAKPVVTIMPAFNNEWVIEVHTYEGELVGRFTAVDSATALISLQSLLMKYQDPPRFDPN